MLRSLGGFLLALVCLVAALPAAPVEMEENSPGYLTDMHGAGGVLRALLEVKDEFPQYEKYMRGTLQWLYDVRIERDGAYTWMMSTTAPEGHPSHRESPGVAFQTASIILQIDPELNDPLYSTLYEGCMKTLEKRYSSAQAKRSPKGRKAKQPIGLGHSHGLGSSLSGMSELYSLTKDERFRSWAISTADLIKDNADEWKAEDGSPMATWRLKPNERPAWRQTDWRTGWCYGTAGMVYGLMEFHNVFPDHRFHDGSSALDLASAGLNWLITKKVTTGKGWSFQNMRTDGPSENPGWGSGVAGIGYVFLRGYEYYKDSDPDLAAIYLDAARKSAVYIVELLELGWDYQGKAHRVQNGTFEHLNLALCGGVGGTGRFLVPMARAIEESDAELAERCIAATRVIASWYRTRAISCGSGIAWTARPKFGGENTINMAIDYGLTGMIIALHDLAVGLDDPELMELTGKALEGMVSLAVKEGDGYKWPLFTPTREVRE